MNMDSILTFAASHGYKIGDIVKISTDPNSVRMRVVAVVDSVSVRVLARRRASKGYRRHVRRMKAKG